MLTRRTWLGVLFVGPLAAACAADGQGPTTGAAAASSGAPSYIDPLQGLYSRPASSVPKDVPVNYYAPGSSRGAGKPRAVLTMAIVPGANFDILQNYFDARVKASPSAAADLDTKKTVQRVVGVIKERYPWVELMDDIATAKRRNVSLTLVVDIRAVLGGFMSSDVAQVDVIVFDADRQPISRLTVEGRGRGFQAALGEALDQLSDRAREYLT